MVSHNKTARKIYEGSRTFSGSKITAILSIIIIAIALIIILTTLVNDNTEDADILVVVNGHGITRNELDTQWNTLPPQTKLELSRDQLLGELIQERVLLQEAIRLDITTSSEEVEGFISNQLALSGATLDQFKSVLAQQNTPYEEIEKVYQKQLVITKLLEEISADTNVSENITEEDVTAFYEANQDLFTQEEQVTVRHILIQEDVLINETADERIAAILESLEATNGSTFCELVTNYTADRASEPTCGEYTFGLGIMVPEFEETSFTINVGDVAVVGTQFGTHIIEKLDEMPAKELEIDELFPAAGVTVENYIQFQLEEEVRRQFFEIYLISLIEGSSIIFSEGVSVPPQFSN